MLVRCAKKVSQEKWCLFSYKFISNFITFSPNLVANHTQISSIPPPPPCYFSSTTCTSSLAAPARSRDPVEWHAFFKLHPPPDCRNSRSPRRSKLLSPPPSLGVTGQLCYSNTSRPNSALGRGGIRNPIPRCLALANQHLRPLGGTGIKNCWNMPFIVWVRGEVTVVNCEHGEREAGVLLPCFANKRLISI